MNKKIKEFIKKSANPAVVTYEYGIPTGEARTKGFGNPGEISVLLVDKENFKTRNSPHILLEGPWSIRRDYGTIKGHCFRAREEAENAADKWREKIFN